MNKEFSDFIARSYKFIDDRRNTTELWYSSDQEEVYKAISKDGRPNYYGPGDFEYKFNSYGFRCDEFHEESELPIVFLGCSMTEGVGTPIEDSWPYMLCEKFRAATGKKIPFWSLAIAGTGPMTQANLLFHFQKYITKPAIVVTWLPPGLRMEFNYGPMTEIVLNNPWSRDTIPYSAEVTEDPNFQLNMLERQAMIFDAIAEQGTQINFAGWSYEDDEYNIIKNGKNLNLIFPFFYATKIVDGVEINNLEDKSRDLWHMGKYYNETLAEGFWKSIVYQHK